MRGYIDGEKIRLSEEIQDALFEAVGRCPEILYDAGIELLREQGHTDEAWIHEEATRRAYEIANENIAKLNAAKNSAEKIQKSKIPRKKLRRKKQ